MSGKGKSKAKPLSLADTLHDLALLRASDVDLSNLLPSDPIHDEPRTEDNKKVIESALEDSYTFSTQARNAIKILNRGDLETQGEKIGDIRGRLEDVLSAL